MSESHTGLTGAQRGTTFQVMMVVFAVLACTSPQADKGALGSVDSGAVSQTDSGTTDTNPADTGTDVPDPRPQGLLIAQSWERRDAPFGAGAGQYRVIFLQESMHTLIPEIRAANPDALILGYQKVGGMRADGGDTPSTGVQIQEAEDGHESWFLHDADGNRLYYCDYAGVAAANIGDVGYQQRWLSNVQERLLAHGFDGVMMDDVNTFPGHCLGSRGTPITEYPTDAAYGDAVVDFLAAVGPSLQAAGLAVAPNVAMNPWDDTMRGQTRAMLPSISHLVREYWMRWDDSPNFTGDEWLQTLTLMEEAEASGIGFLGLTYGPGDEGVALGQRFGRASFLLAWDGEQDSAWGYKDENVDPWSEEWARELGRPAGARTAEGVGWWRAYDNGRVLVNADEDASQVFALGEPLRDHSGAAVESVTLGPGEAALLLRP